MSDEPMYPHIHVKLTRTDGNAMSSIGRVHRALRKVATQKDLNEFRREALSGDYEHVLETACKWVNVS